MTSIYDIPTVAITLWPEWIYAICQLGKDYENRSWRLPERWLGQRIALHAGKHIGGGRPSKREKAKHEHWAMMQVYQTAASALGPSRLAELPEAFVQMVRGDGWASGYSGFGVVTSAVVATATFDRCDGPTTPRGDLGWRNHGCFAWHIADLLVLDTPLPCKGKQNIWDLSQTNMEQGPTAFGALPCVSVRPVKEELRHQLEAMKARGGV